MNRLFVSVCLAALSCAAVDPAAALTTKECSTKYQAAKQAGTLNGQKWNDFRKAECGAEASNTTANTVPNPVATGATKSAAPAPAPQAPAARSTAAPAGTAAYPSA